MLKDMRKDDIVTEKETTFRANRVVAASNNRRCGGVDEFIIRKMRAAGKMKGQIDKPIEIIDGIRRGDDKASAIELF